MPDRRPDDICHRDTNACLHQPIQLPVGSYAITATYAADPTSSYTSNSASNKLNVTITQATTTTQVNVNPSIVSSGGAVTITALISTNSNGAAPTGTVQFTNNGSAIAGTVTYTGSAFNPNTGQPATLVATITTTVSALPGPVGNDRRPPMPLAPIAILAFTALAYLAFWLTMPPVRRRGYAYAGLAMFLLGAGLIAGCGGGGATSSGSTICRHSSDVSQTSSGQSGNFPSAIHTCSPGTSSECSDLRALTLGSATATKGATSTG